MRTTAQRPKAGRPVPPLATRCCAHEVPQLPRGSRHASAVARIVFPRQATLATSLWFRWRREQTGALWKRHQNPMNHCHYNGFPAHALDERRTCGTGLAARPWTTGAQGCRRVGRSFSGVMSNILAWPSHPLWAALLPGRKPWKPAHFSDTTSFALAAAPSSVILDICLTHKSQGTGSASVTPSRPWLAPTPRETASWRQFRLEYSERSEPRAPQRCASLTLCLLLV
jgi:hypothetical protein